MIYACLCSYQAYIAATYYLLRQNAIRIKAVQKMKHPVCLTDVFRSFWYSSKLTEIECYRSVHFLSWFPILSLTCHFLEIHTGCSFRGAFAKWPLYVLGLVHPRFKYSFTQI
jgi:hypothetical protein